MGAVSFSESDLTYEMPDSEEVVERELTVVAVPVYGGRVADTAIERLKKFVGKDSPFTETGIMKMRCWSCRICWCSKVLHFWLPLLLWVNIHSVHLNIR